jgi:hypothetical protein
MMKYLHIGLILGLSVANADAAQPQLASSGNQLTLHLSWGHTSPKGTAFYVKLMGDQVSLANPKGEGLEPREVLKDGAWQTEAGGRHVDEITVTLRYGERSVKDLDDLHVIWRDLIAQSDPDTGRRLKSDPSYHRDNRKLTVQLNREGTRGFSVTVEQLLQNKVFWVPSLDVLLSLGENPVSFAEHQRELSPLKGKRILDQVQAEPEATYEQYTARWEDMGNPGYLHPSQPAPGHIVCLSWDSAIPKYGIDRGAGVWNDYGNPDRFRFWFDNGDYSSGIKDAWKGQHLEDGLPVITTSWEKGGVRYEIQQFAYPLIGPPPERRGDIPMVLLQQVTLTNLDSKAKAVPLKMTNRREVPAGTTMVLVANQGVIEDRASGCVLFSIQGPAAEQCVLESRIEKSAPDPDPRKLAEAAKRPWTTIAEARVQIELPTQGSQTLVVKLPSPVVLRNDRAKLLSLDYAAARAGTLKFWGDYLARGAQFRVPEKAVNDLFRASLWHALRLPRRHGGKEPGVKIDLPYSNFAYDQYGTPWPVNQATLVDYMLYDLRGYHAISGEELQAIYRNNQEPNGHVGGYANWGSYTPSMIYSVAQQYLLSRDRAAFERLLPASLKALDWCLGELRRAANNSGAGAGMVHLPANDLTGEGVWAWTNGYLYAGIELFGRALQQHGHPRAQECLATARDFRQALNRAFGVASVQSPLVQLRDHTWIPYVPCEALTPRRMMEVWYPTDVDGGATHLLRLRAVDANGALAESLLNDHEDTLYLKGWGMANEPVYNQQGLAYLLRDEPKAAIRTFYSQMACAFSHSVYESVEHRWTWGQYFCPPSTDGTWFELYRNMLIREQDDDTLLLLQATPRKWLENGKQTRVERAPTYYGTLNLSVTSHVSTGEIRATVEIPSQKCPQALLVRLRHPEAKRIREVVVNGRDWKDFDAQKEWVRIAAPKADRYDIVARY